MKRNEIFVGGEYAVTTDKGHASLNKKWGTRVYKGTVLEKGVPMYYNNSMRPIGFKVEVEIPDLSKGEYTTKVYTLPAISFRSIWQDELLRDPGHFERLERQLAEVRERAEMRDGLKERALAIVSSLDPEQINVGSYEVGLSFQAFHTLLDDLEAKDALLDYFYKKEA